MSAPTELGFWTSLKMLSATPWKAACRHEPGVSGSCHDDDLRQHRGARASRSCRRIRVVFGLVPNFDGRAFATEHARRVPSTVDRNSATRSTAFMPARRSLLLHRSGRHCSGVGFRSRLHATGTYLLDATCKDAVTPLLAGAFAEPGNKALDVVQLHKVVLEKPAGP